MPRRFELIVFDWDGTLMDSAGVIVASLRAACSDLGLPVPSEEGARYVIGLGLRDAMAHILPDVAPSTYPGIAERYRDHFMRHDRDTTLFAGATELISRLRESGFLLAVATGKSRRGLDRSLAATGLKPYFHATRCADEGFSKPHPGMLEALLDELDVAPEKALMVGDTIHDMKMAHAAGVSRVGVTHGAHEKAALLDYEPLTCVENLAELDEWLMRHA